MCCGRGTEWCALDACQAWLVDLFVLQLRGVVIWWKIDGSTLWKAFEPGWNRLALVFIRVVVGAMLVETAFQCWASPCFVHFGVVFAFFPPVTLRAHQPVLAPILIITDGSWLVPLGALDLTVLIKWRLASKVLPIVREDALVPLVRFLVEGAPDRLMVKHIKVSAPFKPIYQVDRYLLIWMCKCTEVSVFTLCIVI